MSSAAVAWKISAFLSLSAQFYWNIMWKRYLNVFAFSVYWFYTVPAALWPLQWYQQEQANKLCCLMYAAPLWLIGFAVWGNRVSCIKNFERCELFSIWLMKLEIHISSLDRCCVSTLTSRVRSEWEFKHAALVQHSAKALLSQPFIVHQQSGH